MEARTYRVVVTDEDGTLLDSLEVTLEEPPAPDPETARKAIVQAAFDIRHGIQ